MFLILTLTGDANAPVAINIENITDIRHYNPAKSDQGCSIYTVASAGSFISVQEPFEDVISQLGDTARA